MSSVWAIAGKDLLLLFRNKMAVFWTFGFPLVYALFFGLISGGGGKTGKLKLAWVDHDRSEGSVALRKLIAESDAVTVEDDEADAALESVVKGRRTAYVVVPSGLGAALRTLGGDRPKLEVGVDPARNVERGMLEGVLQQALFRSLADGFMNPEIARAQLKSFRGKLSNDMGAVRKAMLEQMFDLGDRALDGMEPPKAGDGDKTGIGSAFQPAQLTFVSAQRDRSREPASAFEIYFPSGILWGVMGCAAGFALALAGEREAGTLTRLKLAPLPWLAVLAGKALACFLASCAVVTGLLIVGSLFFGVRLTQNPIGLVWGVAATSAGFTGLMMLLAGAVRSPGGVSGVGWGFNTVMAMIGGGMIPLIAMPEWLRQMSVISPVRWGIMTLEGAIWRGFSAFEMLTTGGVLVIVGVAAFLAGVALATRRQVG